MVFPTIFNNYNKHLALFRDTNSAFFLVQGYKFSAQGYKFSNLLTGVQGYKFSAKLSA